MTKKLPRRVPDAGVAVAYVASHPRLSKAQRATLNATSELASLLGEARAERDKAEGELRLVKADLESARMDRAALAAALGKTQSRVVRSIEQDGHQLQQAELLRQATREVRLTRLLVDDYQQRIHSLLSLPWYKRLFGWGKR